MNTAEPSVTGNSPKGWFCLILHAHLPFVRHPEHDRFLEEQWLFEAVAETYVPLLRLLGDWERDGLPARLTLTLTPTLCAMLQDELLRARCRRYLDELIDLAEKEAHRTLFEPGFKKLALFYLARFHEIRTVYVQCGGDLVGAFRGFQDRGRLEIITCAATHAVLPLLADSPASLRAQVLAGRDDYLARFGRAPRGIWLPECAWSEAVEPALCEAGLRWFVTDTHGLLNARPRPRFAVYAPVITPNGLAAFGRDYESAKQVWSRHEGYPGDPRYREFYRDIGFDLEYEYIRPHLAAPGKRGFTGLKYYRITGGAGPKAVYDPEAAAQAAAEHAAHFLRTRLAQTERLAHIMKRPPVLVAPYDAELFGHWWYEGPEFLDRFVRETVRAGSELALESPEAYLRAHPEQQLATPAASSWGEEGYWRVWLNESNHWIYPHLRVAQHRMTDLARRFTGSGGLTERALRQAGRELLLAQSSDWPFILRTGTSPDYARKRFTEHIVRFTRLYEQLRDRTIDQTALAAIETQDNFLPNLDCSCWKDEPTPA